MKASLKTVATALLSFGAIGTHSARATIALEAGDWVGQGEDTLVSTTANWHGNMIPPWNMRFSSGAYGKTVTFDKVYTVQHFVWTGTDEPGKFYNPTTGETNPVVWEATDPSFGIIQEAQGDTKKFMVSDNASQNAALLIRGGTYTAKGIFDIASAGAGWLCLEEGTIKTMQDLVMAGADRSVARLIVGSGDATRTAQFIVPTDKWAFLCRHASSDGQITLKAGGEFHCAYICSQSDKGILRFDGGTLVKDGDVVNQVGWIYGNDYIFSNGSGDKRRTGNQDGNKKLEVTANGGTIDVKTYNTTLGATVYLAEGAEDGVLTKRGSATLTLENAASGFGGTFRAAEGTLKLGTVGESTKAILDGGYVTIGGGTLAKLTLADGFDASVANLPAHAALCIKGGATLQVDSFSSGALAATFDADVSAQNPVTINVLSLGNACTDRATAYPVVSGLSLEDGPVDFVRLTGLAGGGSCFIGNGNLMLKLATEATAAVQFGLDTLYPDQGWVASDVGDARLPDAPSGQVGDSIFTHPAGNEYADSTPAKLTRTLKITGDAPYLHLKVRSYKDGNAVCDWVLKVFVDGVQLGADATVCSDAAVDYYFPLAAYANKGEVTLQLQNAPGGAQDWNMEVACWDLIEIVELPIETASWTNGTGDNDPTNPDNWVCKNAAGVIIYNVLPSAATTVSLDSDCTWTAWPNFFTADSTIDLNGHNLTVPQLGEGKITDSSVAEKYELLEYIESGDNQYIDTGYTHLADTRIEAVIDVSGTQPKGISHAVPFGSLGTGDAKNNNLAFFAWFGTTTVPAYNRGTEEKSGSGFFYNTKVCVTCQGLTASWQKVDDPTAAESIVNTGTMTNGDRSMYLFGLNEGAAPLSHTYLKMKLYSCKMWDDAAGTQLRRNLVPARRLADGKVGLLDLANPGENEFYENKAAGVDFVPGVVTNRPPVGELHVNVAGGETSVNSAVTLSGGIPLVKDGAGTLTWGGGTLTAATPILVTNGVFKMGVTTQDVFGEGGTITVKGKGQYDLNQNVVTSPTIYRTFFIEGDGPDGTGAIVNNASGTNGGKFLKTINLTGDATIGGSHYIDIRATAGTCMLNGEDHVLTIKNTARVVFCEGYSGCRVNRIVVDGGFLQPCSDSTEALDVKECIELKNGGRLISWHANKEATYVLDVPVVVSEGSGMIGSDQGSLSLKDVEVCAEATLGNEKGVAYITGTLSGSGAVTGANIAFSGAAACWQVNVNEVTAQKVNLESAPEGFLAELKKVEVVLAARALRARYELCAAGDLTDEEAAEIEVTAVAAEGAPDGVLKPGTWRATVANGKLWLVNPHPQGLMLLFR